MSDEEKTCCCHCRTKHRDDKEERDLLNRLSRIEGQIRGIRGMLEKSAYCPDILAQAAAANAAAAITITRLPFILQPPLLWCIAPLSR